MMIQLFQRAAATSAILIVSCFICSTATAQPTELVSFDQYLEKKNTVAGGTPWVLEKFCPVSTNIIARRVLESYGAMFVAKDSVELPVSCVQKGEGQVLAFQKKIPRTPIDVRGVRIDLQTAAAQALQQSINEAEISGLTISALDGPIAGGRSYGDTLMLWNSRVFPALAYWIRRGKLTSMDFDELAKLALEKKVEKILEWESKGIYFSTDRSRSILTSTAPPGTSQHLSLIAFDVVEYWNPQVRSILNRNGWFQTVVDDPPHFTYLGVAESELPSRGLIAVLKNGHQYWIPNRSATIVTDSPTN
ncbi:MAG: hypothetical protein DMF63_13345 [Acidobacteria bacterium]|nr:MAG: hypothetical protein DMF63_13345 [Acidobacteriota bacterium]